jgi:diguanylate cyclase (GGDEF)-like protein
VLFIDLDGFKSINDNYGHDVGDAALVAVAQRLEQLKREADTAARLGGDEFTLLLESIETREGALRVAERVVESFARPLIVGEFEVTVTVSVGLAYSESRITVRELVRRADTAMYQAKKLGKRRFVEWEPRHDTLMPRSHTPPPPK